jgi:hypothetical protein
MNLAFGLNGVDWQLLMHLLSKLLQAVFMHRLCCVPKKSSTNKKNIHSYHKALDSTEILPAKAT